MITKSRDMIKLGIYGVPRSGTSWLGEIFNSSPYTHYRYQPLFSYAHKNFLGPYSSEEDIQEFFDRLLRCNDPFTTQKEKRNSGSLPQFEKEAITHIVHKEGQSNNILFNLMRKSHDVKVIAIIRSPLSVINSWLKAPSEFRRDLGWSELEEWRYALKKNLNRPEMYHGFEKWKEAVNSYLFLQQEFPDRFYVVNYRSLLHNTIEETKKMFSFVELPLTQKTEQFLYTSSTIHNVSPYSVFRESQSDDKWKTELNTDIAEAIIAELQGTILETYL